MAVKRKNKYGWVQKLRFAVQLAVFVAVIFAGFHTKLASQWLLPTILLLGVFFCGWICPFGAAQDWAAWLGRKFRIPRLRMPLGVQRYLQLARYVLYLLLTMGIVFSLLKGPHHYGALIRTGAFTAGTIVVLSMIVLGMIFDRPFCNYLCTGGARMGLFSVLRIFGIRRKTEQCLQCGQCSRQCPMNIDVAKTEFVRHPNCIGCMSCVSACSQNCLSYSLMPRKEENRGKKSERNVTKKRVETAAAGR